MFALLAASVHHTFPGFNFKYRPSHSTFQNSLAFPGITFYPNGTVELVAQLNATFSDIVPFVSPAPEVAALNNRLVQVGKFGPTNFPIFFAGIVGSTLRLLARWRAERGSSIEVKRYKFFCVLLRKYSQLTYLGAETRSSYRKHLSCQHLDDLVFARSDESHRDWSNLPLGFVSSGWPSFLRVLEKKNVIDSAAITASWSGGSSPGYDPPSGENTWLPKLYGNYIAYIDSYLCLDFSNTINGPSDWILAYVSLSFALEVIIEGRTILVFFPLDLYSHANSEFSARLFLTFHFKKAGQGPISGLTTIQSRSKHRQRLPKRKNLE